MFMPGVRTFSPVAGNRKWQDHGLGGMEYWILDDKKTTMLSPATASHGTSYKHTERTLASRDMSCRRPYLELSPLGITRLECACLVI